MLKKLLKYDMVAVWRFWWILALGVLGLSTVGAFVLRFVITYIENPNFSFFTTIGILFLVLCGLAVFSSYYATYIFVYLRFYKNFFTDEGYLTFTLPVSRRQLFLSKTLNALIWQVSHIFLLLLAALIVATFAPPPTDGGLINPEVLYQIGDFFSTLWRAVGGWTIVYLLEALLLAVIGELFSIGLIHFCITIGAIIAKKAKLLAAIGIYYAINMAFSFAAQIFGTISLMILIEGFLYRMQGMSPNTECLAISLILLVICAMMAVLVSLLYCGTLDRIERKLNLA